MSCFRESIPLKERGTEAFPAITAYVITWCWVELVLLEGGTCGLGELHYLYNICNSNTFSSMYSYAAIS